MGFPIGSVGTVWAGKRLLPGVCHVMSPKHSFVYIFFVAHWTSVQHERVLWLLLVNNIFEVWQWRSAIWIHGVSVFFFFLVFLVGNATRLHAPRGPVHVFRTSCCCCHGIRVNFIDFSWPEFIFHAADRLCEHRSRNLRKHRTSRFSLMTTSAIFHGDLTQQFIAVKEFS